MSSVEREEQAEGRNTGANDSETLPLKEFDEQDIFDDLFSASDRTAVLASMTEDVQTALVTLSIKLVAHEDLSLSERATVVLLCILEQSLHALHSLIAAAERHSSAGADAVVSMRYLHLIARVAAIDDAHFESCVRANAIELILRSCRSSDVLLAMAAIELLHELARCRAGLSYLVSSGTLLWLMEQADAADALLKAEAMRELSLTLSVASSAHLLDSAFFDALQAAHILSRLLLCLQSHLEDSSEESKITGLSALTDFATCSVHSLQLIATSAALRDAWLSLVNGKVELQAAVINSVALVVSHEYAAAVSLPQQQSSSSSVSSVSSVSSSSSSSAAATAAPIAMCSSLGDDLKKNLVQELCSKRRLPSVAALLSKFLLQPIESPRVAALRLVRALASCSSGWGLLLLVAGDAALRDYLMQAGTEVTRDCRQAKYEAVLALSLNPQLSLVGEETASKLRRLASLGPYYCPPKLEDPMTVDR